MAEKQTNKSKNALARKNPFPHKDLISVKDLTKEETLFLIKTALTYLKINRVKPPQKLDDLRGYNLVNFFLEPSTRTRISFETAAYRLGMNVINFAHTGSSMSKEETIGDTIRTIYAMNPDFLVLRVKEKGLPKEFSKNLDCSVINAGDGDNEHPTQALLDAASIYCDQLVTEQKQFDEITITICGDILHSRVARSNILLLKKLGAKVKICGPQELMPKKIPEGVELLDDFESALKVSDYVMMLRYQKERMKNEFSDQWITNFRLTQKRMANAKKNIIVLHPGPINPNREISLNVAYSKQSLITQQIAMGVSMRMAILKSLADSAPTIK